MKKVSIIALIWAHIQDRLLAGLTYILSPVVKVMSKIPSAALGIQSRARATIARRTIEQTKPVDFEWKTPGCSSVGVLAQTTGPSGLPQSSIAGMGTGHVNRGLGYQALAQGTGYQNTALGYQAGMTYTNNIRPSTITFSQNNKPVLTITQDGDVEWTGKPSEAADAIMQVLQIRVEDKKGITKAARRRYYALACRNILEQAEKMEYEEFLAYLNREVYNRDSKVIMDSLRGEEDADQSR